MKKYIIAIFVFIVSCVTTGPGGKKDFIIISSQQEVSIGKEIASDVESTEKLLKDAIVQNYVNKVGQKIVKVCDRKDIDYSFRVIDKDEVNAFACPGGFIYIYTGLLEILDNEAQLSTILAHEVGHVVARHSVKRLQTLYGYSILMEIALGDKIGETARNVIDLGTVVILQGYSRDNEFEADRYGILYARKSGYNPEGMIQVFKKFKAVEGNPPTIFHQLLASHPPSSDRIKEGNKEIQKIGGTNLPFYEDEYSKIKSRL